MDTAKAMVTAMDTVKKLGNQEPEKHKLINSERQGVVVLFSRSVCGILCISWSLSAFSGQVERGYGLHVRKAFTDNSCLSPTDKKPEWYTTITPTLNLKGVGARSSFSVLAAVEGNSLTDYDGCSSVRGGDVHKISPRLKADGNVDLYSNFLYLDGSAYIAQNAINPFIASGDNAINRTDNINTTYNFNISPYIQHRFGRAAEVYARYRFDYQDNTESSVDDNERHSANASLSSVPGTSRLSWTLSGNYQKIYYSNGNTQDDDYVIANAYFQLNYSLTRKWSVYASTGEDFNDFVSEDSDIDGSTWTAGISWVPTPRTSIEVGTGNRFFGSTPTLNITHRHKFSDFRFSYDKILTFTSDLRNFDQFFQFVDENGDPVLNPDGELILISQNQTTLTRSPIVDERVSVSYNWTRRRTSVSLKASRSDQLRLEDNINTVFSNYTVGVSRKLSQKLTLNGRLSYRETDVPEEYKELGLDPGQIVQNSEVYSAYIGFSRNLGVKTSVNAGYTFVDRSSELAEDEYQENRFTVGINMTW
ncbi:TIGR03016 family PEP-CTERM system-associated outer membrane protein [Aestuariicella hydrocarbonica]|uniref:TIGR03016 family PEP-CTERM system-associated outer membrane protein n=1 Tax=Pseudomaricurvus hydrocarbonicus TaxID=1470433 RepID=A0A9E5JQC2_9GAMM|nr:TIGR03016 family PEP-CTERM system-associated outer membrane protein [Aestuariicella hydrocarbonica]NHO64698.1 TIGR03016 family PEP-CTERM system-associated outer membrane protein [Aestuariicella hydrocarbonica]